MNNYKHQQVKVASLSLAESDRTQNIRKATAAIALAFFALFLPACNGETEQALEEPATTAEAGADVEDVEEDTGEYLGEVVTISGEIETVLSPNAFILQEEELFGDEDVLVVSEEEVLFAEGDYAEVTGIVENIVITELETEYGFDLDPELEVEYENRPVVVAEATQVVE